MPTDASSTVLLDTHSVIWWQAESGQLSKTARKRIENASKRLVSSITFWELTMLVEKGPVTTMYTLAHLRCPFPAGGS